MIYYNKQILIIYLIYRMNFSIILSLLLTLNNILISKSVGESSFNSTDGQYVFKGINASLSFINKDINTKTSINDLQNIQLIILDTLIIDADFFIQEERYRTNAPNLMIIAREIVIEKVVKIDLSCHKVPPYPDNQAKAKNGERYGEDGFNGKQGLDGYNGGSLIIVAGDILEAKNILFSSNGGVGGS